MARQTSEQIDLLSTSPDEIAFLKKKNLVKNVDVNVIPEDNNKFIQVIRPLLVELIGTALFVLIGLWGACSGGGVLAAALSFGLALAVLAASFGHISGVHFNPSVTIGVLIAGEMQAVMAILYVVVQLLGGIAAAGLLRLLLTTRTYQACKGGATLLTKYAAYNVTGNNGRVYHPADYVQNWQGILIEAIVTFVLVTVILMVALDTKSKTGLAPLLIGFALAVNILAIGAYTGGSLNPARSLGPAIFAVKWEDHYVYWIGPLVGAIVAGFLYRTVWAHHDRRMFVKHTKTTTTTVKQ
jgi:aquaporin related protein